MPVTQQRPKTKTRYNHNRVPSILRTATVGSSRVTPEKVVMTFFPLCETFEWLHIGLPLLQINGFEDTMRFNKQRSNEIIFLNNFERGFNEKQPGNIR